MRIKVSAVERLVGIAHYMAGATRTFKRSPHLLSAYRDIGPKLEELYHQQPFRSYPAGRGAVLKDAVLKRERGGAQWLVSFRMVIPGAEGREGAEVDGE